jgi:ribosomal protein S18 acetylase RimI-like enzyme
MRIVIVKLGWQRPDYGKIGKTQVCSALATLHASAFPGFFLTSLGQTFLRRLYAGFITHPQGICLVAEEEGTMIGFVAGTMSPSNFFRELLRRQALRFAIAAIPGLLRSPLFATRKCLGALFYRGETPGGIPDAALLSSIAVAQATQSKGAGQALVQAFVEEVRMRGGTAIYLTTDESENERANRFYAKCGFTLLDTFKRPGKRVMNRWIMKLT